ncbi:MAG: VWA domain-containing protein, partial [Paramuribaculum sp.]|nr:VWA domain-containing protein [Paramuribaculum sp.]
QYLYLLAAVPLLALLYTLARISRRRKLRRFGRQDVIKHLMPEASRYTGWLKLALELLALTAIIFALARPVAPSRIEKTETESTQGIEVMICLDVSNSMLASATDDPNGVSRLQRARFILEKMIDKMNNDKVGLIVFAGESYTQLPITSDYISAKMFLNDLSTDMVPTQGTAIGAAIDMAVTSFTPDSDCDKAIIIITDGENFEDDAVAEAARAASAGIQVDVIGVGSGNGAPIPLKGKMGEYMTDQNGAPVVTKLDETTAEEIAKAGKGIYLSGASSSVTTELDDQLSKLKKSEYQRLTSSPAAELFPIFAIIALLLLLVDTIIPYRKISWLRGINFFTKSAKTVAIVTLLSGVWTSAWAANDAKPTGQSNRYERNYVADGNKLYKEKRFAEAEVMYKKALESNPNSETALFNLAASYIRQAGSADPNSGNNPMAQASEILNRLAKEASNQTISELAYYNLGNMAFNQENYQQSIESYKNALRRNPDNDKARENLRLAQLKLKDQQNDDKNKDQNHDNQDQNQ